MFVVSLTINANCIVPIGTMAANFLSMKIAFECIANAFVLNVRTPIRRIKQVLPLEKYYPVRVKFVDL